MNYPQNLVFQNPNKTWSFVGRVSVKLAWKNKDGTDLSDEQADELSTMSNPAMKYKVKVYQTKEAAIEAAKNLGVDFSA